jgi:hypothetical protein
MQRRTGFTLVEMLVAMALTIFIMVILSTAFVTGLETFRQLKGIGDMQESLRVASQRIQNDLRADHFEAGRKLSDADFWIPAKAYGDGPPRMGFLRVVQGGASVGEGNDQDSLPSFRAANHVLHMSIRLRGNHREGFLSASVPAGSPVLTANTTLGNQPADARFQDPANPPYTSAWGEVAYFLVLQGTTVEPNNPNATTGTPLYRLIRMQKVVVADATAVNAAAILASQANLTAYAEMSCETDPQGSGNLVFNSPLDLANGQRSITNFSTFPQGGASSLLGNVVSFQVQILVAGGTGFQDVPNNTFDTAPANQPNPPYTITAVQITLRVWDSATQQARQVTIAQDM